MKKRLITIFITAVFCLFFATFVYASSTSLSFSGSGGSILIVTTAPGIDADEFEVNAGENLSVNQQVSTSSPTAISREGEFSGGGFIRAITDTTDPDVTFGAYLSSNGSGWLGESVDTGSSANFGLSAEGKGNGRLEIIAYTGEWLSSEFVLGYDACTMGVMANANQFNLGWVTEFDSWATIEGGVRAD